MFATLPPDLVYEIFVRIPDVQTLFAAICTSKSCHDIFQGYPKTILSAVIQNIVGAALAPAARLTQYRAQECDRVDDLPQERIFAGPDWVMPHTMVYSLEQHAASVRVLRDFYSQRQAPSMTRVLSPTINLSYRNKDRASSTSQLDSEERVRFDAAIYRYWLYCDMVSRGAFLGADDDDEDEDFNTRLHRMLYQELSILSNDELFQLYHVGQFLEEFRRWHSRIFSLHSGESGRGSGLC